MLGECQVHILNTGASIHPVIVPEHARRALLVRLRTALRHGFGTRLCDKTNQWEIVSVSDRNHYSNNFMLAGKYTRFVFHSTSSHRNSPSERLCAFGVNETGASGCLVKAGETLPPS